MRIGELSKRTGLSRDTLRFYEKRGLIRSQRSPNGYRDYGDDAVFVLDYIRTAQSLGFGLDEIAAELPALYAEEVTPERIAVILADKIAVIDERIARLVVLRDALSARMEEICPPVMPPDRLAPVKSVT